MIVTIHFKSYRYYIFWTQETFTTLKHVYLVKKKYYYIVLENFSNSLWNIANTLSYRHNVLIVFYEVVRLNKQIPLIKSNKSVHRGSGSRSL